MLLFPVRRAPHREGGDGAGNQETTKGPMSGMTVLVVEDDFIVAYDMQMMLEEQGARVLGPATSLAEAQAAAGERAADRGGAGCESRRRICVSAGRRVARQGCAVRVRDRLCG